MVQGVLGKGQRMIPEFESDCETRYTPEMFKPRSCELEFESAEFNRHLLPRVIWWHPMLWRKSLRFLRELGC